MFIRMFSAFLKDTITSKKDYKYRFLYIKGKKVSCEFVETSQIINFDLEDAINEKLHLFAPKDILSLVKLYYSDQSETKNGTANILKYYYILALTFILCLLLSNISGTKLCNFFGFTMTGGIIFFPLLYVINDVLTEVYGFIASRKVIVAGLLASLVFNFCLYIVVLVPAASNSVDHEAFNLIFALSPRIFISSLISYFLGEFINAVLISILKEEFSGQYFAFRAIISTCIGSITESLIFCTLVFWGKLSLFEIISMALTATITKVLFEFMFMPITLKLVGFLKTKT